jgi:mevalonate kinase
VDVATSTLGGTIAARRDGDSLRTHAVVLPRELHLALLAAGVPASTSALVAKVDAAKSAARADYDAVMERLFRAADAAERGFETGSAKSIVAALALQLVGLTDLGRLAGASIVTSEVARLAALAGTEGAVVLPAGAGGGDIAIYAGIAPPSAELRRAFDAERHRTLDVRFGVRGLHQIPQENAVA